MRTRVALDPDTEHLIRQRMKDKGVSFKRALNDVIREGAGAPGRAAYESPVFDLGIPSVDLTKALRLAGDLEDEGRSSASTPTSRDSPKFGGAGRPERRVRPLAEWPQANPLSGLPLA